jgi:hypothetical protein
MNKKTKKLSKTKNKKKKKRKREAMEERKGVLVSSVGSQGLLFLFSFLICSFVV